MQILVGHDRHEMIKQGFYISNEMKADIIDLYYKSIAQREYKNHCDYMRQRLELKYGFNNIKFKVVAFRSLSQICNQTLCILSQPKMIFSWNSSLMTIILWHIWSEIRNLRIKEYNMRVLLEYCEPFLLNCTPMMCMLIEDQYQEDQRIIYFDIKYRYQSSNYDSQRPPYYDEMPTRFPYTG